MTEKRGVDPINALRQRRYEAAHGDADGFRRQHARGKLTARERVQRLVVELWSRLREQRRFDSLDELVAAIGDDVDRTRASVKPG